MKLPISAVLPIYNCRDRLARHLQSVEKWVSLVHEIIVVDSGSTDGSLELAKDVLTPFGAHFLHNPPGLYQSWNAGIAAATAPWCYISTVEDPIKADGLHHLLEVGLRHNADVAISPPEMMNHDGSEPVDQMMPSNRLANFFLSAGLDDRALNRSETIVLLCSLIPHGLIGSSASNLYRATFLQQHPFPTNLGHCGDTAWGLSVAPFVKIAFTPQLCSQFYCQTMFRAEQPKLQLERHQKLSELAQRALLTDAGKNPDLAVMLGWFDAYNNSHNTLWEWLTAEYEARQSFQKLYLEMKEKYEGGIFQYILRAFRDEFSRLRIIRKKPPSIIN